MSPHIEQIWRCKICKICHADIQTLENHVVDEHQQEEHQHQQEEHQHQQEEHQHDNQIDQNEIVNNVHEEEEMSDSSLPEYDLIKIENHRMCPHCFLFPCWTHPIRKQKWQPPFPKRRKTRSNGSNRYRLYKKTWSSLDNMGAFKLRVSLKNCSMYTKKP